MAISTGTGFASASRSTTLPDASKKSHLRERSTRAPKLDTSLPPVMTIALTPTITLGSCKKLHYSYTAEWVNRDVKLEPRFRDSETGDICSSLDEEFKRVSTYILQGLNDFLAIRTGKSHTIRKKWEGWGIQASQDSEAFQEFTRAVLPIVQANVARDCYRELDIRVISNTQPATVVRRDHDPEEPKCLADSLKWTGVLFAPSWRERGSRLRIMFLGDTVRERSTLQEFWNETQDMREGELRFCFSGCC